MSDEPLADRLERDADELGDIGGLGNVIYRIRLAAAVLRERADRIAELEAENKRLRTTYTTSTHLGVEDHRPSTHRGATVSDTRPKKMLRLTVEVPGIWADDLDGSADALALDGEGNPAEGRLFVVTEEWLRPDVVLTVVNWPGEKCMNEDFELHTYNARIVAADTVDK